MPQHPPRSTLFPYTTLFRSSARTVAQWQPIKLAALEGQFATERGAPLRLGGWPDVDAQRTRFAIEIPRGLSLLAFHRSEEHTSELQSQFHLVCRLLLEKKNN